MPYTIAPSDDGRYIVLKVTGPITRRLSMEQNVEAHALGRKLGIHRFLVDVTESTNTDSVIEGHAFAYEDMKRTEGIDRAARVATVVRPGDHSHDFIETVARNAGLDVTLFTDLELARQHLLRDDPADPPAGGA